MNQFFLDYSKLSDKRYKNSTIIFFTLVVHNCKNKAVPVASKLLNLEDLHVLHARLRQSGLTFKIEYDYGFFPITFQETTSSHK